jgi:DnaJ-class molecular chaperone
MSKTKTITSSDMFNWRTEPCSVCHGWGYKTEVFRSYGLFTSGNTHTVPMTCAYCYGTGRVYVAVSSAPQKETK